MFALVRTAFFIFFVKSTKMVDGKTLKISIGTIIKYPQMLTFVSDHLKTKKMYQNAVKELFHNKVCSSSV